MATSDTEDGRHFERNGKLLDKAVADLYEHFDSVQIFATNHENETTYSQTRGRGNWFARIGNIKAWVVRQDQQAASGECEK